MQAVGTMVAHAPAALACLVGMVLAIVRWKRHPKVSLCLLLGFVVLLVVPLTWSLVSAAVYPALHRQLGSGGFRAVVPLISLGNSLFVAAGYVLLFVAALAGRPARS
jgi:hypothetical protein